jgi:hypothetical protein
MLGRITHIDKKRIVVETSNDTFFFFKGENAFKTCFNNIVKLDDEVCFSLVKNGLSVSHINLNPVK